MKSKENLVKLEQRHKDFAEACIRGESQTDAYIKYISRRPVNRISAAANASRLAADPLIVEYMQKRLMQLEEEGLLNTSKALAVLSGIVARQTPDYQISKDGRVLEVPAKLSDVIQAARLILDRGDKAAAAKAKQTDEERYGVILMPPTEDEGGE